MESVSYPSSRWQCFLNKILIRGVCAVVRWSEGNNRRKRFESWVLVYPNLKNNLIEKQSPNLKICHGFWNGDDRWFLSKHAIRAALHDTTFQFCIDICSMFAFSPQNHVPEFSFVDNESENSISYSKPERAPTRLQNKLRKTRNIVACISAVRALEGIMKK